MQKEEVWLFLQRYEGGAIFTIYTILFMPEAARAMWRGLVLLNLANNAPMLIPILAMVK